MSVEITIPNVGPVAIQRFEYSSGRIGLVAATKDTKEGDYFNLSLNIEGVATDLIILKEWGEAQLINKYLMENILTAIVDKQRYLGYNKIHYCMLIPDKGWAK